MPFACETSMFHYLFYLVNSNEVFAKVAQNKFAFIMDYEDGERLSYVEWQPDKNISSIIGSQDGKHIAALDDKGTVRIYANR